MMTVIVRDEMIRQEIMYLDVINRLSFFLKAKLKKRNCEDLMPLIDYLSDVEQNKNFKDVTWGSVIFECPFCNYFVALCKPND